VEDDEDKRIQDAVLADEQPGTPRKCCFPFASLLTLRYQSLSPRLTLLLSSPRVLHHLRHLVPTRHLYYRGRVFTTALRGRSRPLRGPRLHQILLSQLQHLH
jgi:hypothetical protein